MKINKLTHCYVLQLNGCNMGVYFEELKKDSVEVSLFLRGEMVCYIHSKQATEFYKAWRAMQCAQD